MVLDLRRFRLPENDHLRLAAMILASAELIFWLYAFFYITRHANPLGDNTEFTGMAPLTVVTLCLAFPALVLSPSAVSRP